jgi:hypothetical protein
MINKQRNNNNFYDFHDSHEIMRLQRVIPLGLGLFGFWEKKIVSRQFSAVKIATL